MHELTAGYVKNLSDSERCGIAPGSTKPVFMNRPFFYEYGFEVERLLWGGTLVVLTVFGEVVETNLATDAVHQASLDPYVSQLETPSSPLVSLAQQIQPRLRVGQLIVSIVRTEATAYSRLHPDFGALSALAKLSELVDLLAVGMLSEAIVAASFLQNDAFLTKERIGRYIELLESSLSV